MRLRLKKKILIGYEKSDSTAKIDNVEIKTDLIDIKNEKIFIYFKGKDSSGILTFSEDEIESLMNSLKPFMPSKR